MRVSFLNATVVTALQVSCILEDGDGLSEKSTKGRSIVPNMRCTRTEVYKTRKAFGASLLRTQGQCCRIVNSSHAHRLCQHRKTLTWLRMLPQYFGCKKPVRTLRTQTQGCH